MTKSVTQQTTMYTGKVLRVGHLSLPQTTRQKLGLQQVGVDIIPELEARVRTMV